MTVRYDFTGQVVAITGGSKGIGRAIGEAFLRAGATVEAWDLAPPKGKGMGYATVDVTKPATIAAAAQGLADRHGRLDVVVNNAGFLGTSAPITEADPQEWRRIIDINLTGTYEVCRAVVPIMKSRKHGRIVNIASIAGKEGTPNAAAYSASKAGVIGFTKALAKELVADNIFVNAIAPGPIETDMLQQATEAHVKTMISKCPMGRLAQPEEAAALVLWLASPDCSFNTGAIFDLSGGRATY